MMKKINGVIFFASLMLTACSGSPGSSGTQNAGSTTSELTPPDTVIPTETPGPPVRRNTDPWLLQDLSILFPLPTRLPDTDALKSSTMGTRGNLIPTFASNALPLLEGSLNQAQQATQLQVVAIRIDKNQLRLVWQVLQNSNRNGAMKIAALDAAVHTFYRIDNSDAFLNDVKDVAHLSRQEVGAGQPLTVHPTLAQQGWNSPYGEALKKLILKWAGENNLIKITFTASPQLARWFFGGFNVQNGQILPLEIPRVNTTGTQLFTNGSSTINMAGGLSSPAGPAGQDEFNRLLMNSMAPEVHEPQALQAAHFTAIKLQNPRLGDPTNLDCASCHMAQMVTDWTEDKNGSLQNDSNGQFFSPDYNLGRISADRLNTENVRAFGYFLGNPAVNQRVINDTAFTAEQLNTVQKTKRRI